MTREVTLLLLLAVTAISAKHCPAYDCGQLPTNQCVQQVNSTLFLVQPCGEGLTCQVSDTGDSYCVPKVKKLRYPGDLCTHDDDCLANDCVKETPYVKICSGLDFNQPCTNVYDCEPWNQCDPATLTCQGELDGGSDCETDYQCNNHHVCTVSKETVNKTCKWVFTVENGRPVSNQTDNRTKMNFACRSGFATQVGDEYVCAPAPVSNYTLPKRCEDDSDCVDTTGLYHSTCECSRSPHRHAYCSPFPGDEVYRDLMASMVTSIPGNTMCNTYDRFGFMCVGNYTLEEQQQLLGDDLAAKVTDSPECVQEVLFDDYYDLMKAKRKFDRRGGCPKVECSEKATDDYCINTFTELDGYDIKLTYIVNQCENLTANGCGGETFGLCNYRWNFHVGEACYFNGYCDRSYCANETCYGNNLGDSCANTDCNIGLFCNSTTQCEPQRDIGEPCTVNSECSNLLLCGGDGQCTEQFTYPDREETTDVHLCASGYATNSTGVITCASAPVSPGNKEAAKCDANDDCFSADGSVSVGCVCGLQEDGLPQCEYFAGDSPLQRAIQSYHSLIAAGVSQVASPQVALAVAGLPDNDTRLMYLDYMMHLLMYQNGPFIAGVSDCVVKGTVPGLMYYEMKQARDEILGTMGKERYPEIEVVR